MVRIRSVSILLVLLVCIPETNHAWSLKTHIWIAQQIINDIMDDGKLRIGNKDYRVPEHIAKAIKNHPDVFRSGNLGPDIYPDPITGQITTHPGLANGWQTDEWLNHMILSARSSEEISLAFGFIAHASSDIFAHTYVNNFAGDVFSLVDSEREVELRHLTLEKYIESVTPHPRDLSGRVIRINEEISVPASYISKQLIMNNEVFKQYFKSKTGVHLSSMYGVLIGVQGLETGTSTLIQKITGWGADYYKKQIDLTLDLATAKGVLLVFEANLVIQKKALEAEKLILTTAVKAQENAIKIVEKNPELITANASLLQIQAKAASKALQESVNIASAANDIINDINQKISSIENVITGAACKVLSIIPFVGDVLSEGCEVIDKARRSIRDLQNSAELQKAAISSAQNVANATESERKATDELVNKLKNEFAAATLGLANGSFKLAISGAELKIKLEEKAIEEQYNKIEKAKEVQKKVKDKLDIADGFIDDIKKTIDKYNLITVLIKNWVSGMEKAGEEYVVSSHSVSKKILNGDSGLLDDYLRWKICYSGVFTGMPVQAGETACFATDQLDKIKGKYNELYESLPTILQWMVNPTKKATEKAFKELEPEMSKAKFAFMQFLIDKPTAEFFTLLTSTKTPSRSHLNEIFSRDLSGKGLLMFEEVSKIVDEDLQIQNGYLTPSSFYPLVHSVTLAKLALLDQVTINELIADLSGNYDSPLFGKEVYALSDKNFSILIGAVKSIDGNHQWQAYSLPYPRRTINNKTPSYGYDFYKDKSKGLKIWIDPYLREKVFSKLFVGSAMGTLRNHPRLNAPNYLFPECENHQFPSTQDQNGILRGHDRTCSLISDSNLQYTYLPSGTKQEYEAKYHQCAEVIMGDKHWAVIGSYHKRSQAEGHKMQIERKYPDILIEIWSPQNGNDYWTCMMATCTTKDKAIEARNIAILRGIALDAFVWNPQYPWEPLKKKVNKSAKGKK